MEPKHEHGGKPTFHGCFLGSLLGAMVCENTWWIIFQVVIFDVLGWTTDHLQHTRSLFKPSTFLAQAALFFDSCSTEVPLVILVYPWIKFYSFYYICSWKWENPQFLRAKGKSNFSHHAANRPGGWLWLLVAAATTAVLLLRRGRPGLINLGTHRFEGGQFCIF